MRVVQEANRAGRPATPDLKVGIENTDERGPGTNDRAAAMYEGDDVLGL